MIDGPFRQILPRFTPKLLEVYQRLSLTPNQLTVAAFVCALGAAASVATSYSILALILWWLGRLFDGTDGIYARATGRVSHYGAYLDIVLDMAAYGAMVLGFASRYPDLMGLWLVTLFLYILCITSAMALGGVEQQLNLGKNDHRTLRLATGLAEGGETGLAYSFFLLFPSALKSLVSVWVAVLALTIIMRTLLAWRLLCQAPSEQP